MLLFVFRDNMTKLRPTDSILREIPGYVPTCRNSVIGVSPGRRLNEDEKPTEYEDEKKRRSGIVIFRKAPNLKP